MVIMPVRVDDDPLTQLLSPPANETSEERSKRLAKEAEARRISDEIDERIRQERDALRSENVLKMLLLGQSESGKSTTLKNIQRIQSPETWKAELNTWRTVIQLNLVRAVNLIVEAVSAELGEASISPGVPHDTMSVSPPAGSPPHAPRRTTEDTEFPESEPPSSPILSVHAPVQLSERHQSLWLQFSPLRRVESDLKVSLGAAADEVTEESLGSDRPRMAATPFDPTPFSPSSSSNQRRAREFCVRSHEAWKNVLNSPQASSPRRSGAGDSTELIAAFRDDIVSLWEDELVHEVLRKRRVTLLDSAEYFLNNVNRIAGRTYEPTEDDVMRARLRTLGVQEYRIPFSRSNTLGKEWRIYDVGGARTMRTAWLPYFDDVQSVLFLAPISCFDERLAEDATVNRLKDSFILWKSIVASKMLSKAIIILFLNKCDLLEKKLDSGVQVSKFIPRYGNRENSMPVFGRYLRDKFKDYMNEYSPHRRQFYGYLTSVVDTKATAATLLSIQDGILHANLEKGIML